MFYLGNALRDAEIRCLEQERKVVQEDDGKDNEKFEELTIRVSSISECLAGTTVRLFFDWSSSLLRLNPPWEELEHGKM